MHYPSETNSSCASNVSWSGYAFRQCICIKTDKTEVCVQTSYRLVDVYCKEFNRRPGRLLEGGVYFTLALTMSTKQIRRVVCSPSKIENRDCE